MTDHGRFGTGNSDPEILLRGEGGHQNFEAQSRIRRSPCDILRGRFSEKIVREIGVDWIMEYFLAVLGWVVLPNYDFTQFQRTVS